MNVDRVGARVKALLLVLFVLVGLVASFFLSSAWHNDASQAATVVLKEREELRPGQEETLNRSTTSPQTRMDKLSDVCIASRAMNSSSLTIRAYFPLKPVTVPNQHYHHASLYLCQQQQGNRNYTDTMKAAQEPVRSVFGFKAARTGSTFFTDVLTKTIRQTRRPAFKYWEPFCSRTCNGTGMLPTIQEETFHKLLTQQCNGHGPCQPAQSCTPFPNNPDRPPVLITAGNPRFFHAAVNWNRVFAGLDGIKLFHIRRTNLILMSYSLFRFARNPCDIGDYTLKLTGNLSLDLLLRIVEHCALGNQELSASVAYLAAGAAGVEPFVVVYEDVLANRQLVQTELVRYLGIHHTNISNDIFLDNSQLTKVHNQRFCDNDNLNCTELEAGLKGRYPCLYKQLVRESEGLTWSVPMLSDGAIHIQGDCFPLTALSKDQPLRRSPELYQLPNQ